MITVPKLRFPEFTDEWRQVKLGDIAQFSKGAKISKNDITEDGAIEAIRYGELYTTYSEIINTVVSKTNLPRKSLVFSQNNDVIIPASGESNIDIATASAVLKDGVALSGDINIIRSNNNGVFLAYYLNNAKKTDIAKLAQGISVVHLYSSSLSLLSLNLPTIPEQTKIAGFLTTVDEKIATIEQKIELLKKYKKAVMQKIFTQQIWLRDINNNPFPKWKQYNLSEILRLRKERNTNNRYQEVFSVAKQAGVINQIEHLGRSYASTEISNYKVVLPFDIIYTKSPTTDFPYGIIKQNKLNRSGVVSVLYGVYEPKNKYIGYILDAYFGSWINTYNYLNPIVQKGAKNTINISDEAFLKGAKLLLPQTEEEHRKITNFLICIDDKISHEQNKLKLAKNFKKSLLQRMFI